MIEQIESFIPAGTEWIYGLLFALIVSLIIYFLLDLDLKGLLALLLVFTGFMVWGDLLDAWIFILVMVLFTLVIAWEYMVQKKEGSDRK